MAFTSRATLPAEFFDITSDMLLVQPEPQYLYARMWKASVGSELNVGPLLGMPGRQFGGDGANYSNLEADRFMMSDPLTSGVVKAVVDLGKAPGHTIRLNRPSFTNSTYTQASREVAAGASISTTGLAVSSEQTSITLKRFAGPYGSAVQPYAIERFDAGLSLHKMAQIHGNNLKRDFDRSIDSFLVALLDLASTAVYPQGMTAVNDSTVAGDFPLDWETVARTGKTMDEANLPTFPDGKRLLVITPQQKFQLQNDALFAKYAEKHPQLNPLLNPGYYKTCGDFHIFQSNTLATTVNSSSVPIHRAHAIAPGVVGSGLGELPRVAFAAEDNYGETAKVIWLLYAGFQLLDSRFVVSVRSS